MRRTAVFDLANRFIDYTLRQVEVLKFAILWEKHATGTGNRKWKTEYLDKLTATTNVELRNQVAGIIGMSHKLSDIF